VRVTFVFISGLAKFRLPFAPVLSGRAARIPPELENAVLIVRRCLPAVGLAVLLACTAVGEATAGALPSAKSLSKDLLTASYAKKAGFTVVAEKPSTSSKTGVKSCPHGAQEAFEDTKTKSGVETEVLACNTTKAASALLTSVSSQGAASGTPPKQLGTSAVERSSSGPVYTIYWRRGDVLEFVGLQTDIPASSSATTTTTTVPAPPITAAQQKVLAAAAVTEYKRLG
jgi:hypothetical protein